MSTPLSLIGRKAQMLGLRTGLDAGSVRYYTGVPPSTPSLGTAESLLASVALSAPCGVVGDASGLATLTLTLPLVTLSTLSGEIGFVRLVDSAGNGFLDLPVGLVNSGKPAILNATQVFTGGEIQLLSCTLAA